MSAAVELLEPHVVGTESGEGTEDLVDQQEPERGGMCKSVIVQDDGMTGLKADSDGDALLSPGESRVWETTQDSFGKRPQLVSHLSHLSGISTDTTTGTSSEGHTFSVDSEEMASKLLVSTLDPPVTETESSSPAISPSPGGVASGISSPIHRPTPETRSSSESTIPVTSPEDREAVAGDIPRSSAIEEQPADIQRIGISRTSSDNTEGPDRAERAGGDIQPAHISPVIESAGTVFADGDVPRGDASDIEAHIEAPSSEMPSSSYSSTTSTTGDVQEVRSEDRMDDWNENQDKAEHQGIYEYRKGLKDHFRFRPAGGKSHIATDPSFATYFGSASPANSYKRDKERERIRADDFDELHGRRDSAQSSNPAERKSSPPMPSRPPLETTPSEEDRARFEAAIRDRVQTVRFKPQRVASQSVTEIADRHNSHGPRSASDPRTHEPAQHSPLNQTHGQSELSRRPSAKRTRSTKMSWDLALLSPAPSNNAVEENERDRASKARGRDTKSPGSSACK